jgi:replicative DNA helicase
MGKRIHISEAYEKAIDYIKKRKTGEEKSIKTPWDKMNQATFNGLEWNTIVVIGGRPGSGKTLLANMLTREAHKLNPDQDFVIIDFQFEMLAKHTALREFAGKTGIQAKKLASVFDEISDAELQAVMQYVEKNKHKDIYIIEQASSVKQIRAEIEQALLDFKKPLIVTIDHSILVKKDASEKDTFETLHNLSKMMTEMKRFKILFIVITQLNRECESQDRLKPGTFGNYLLDSDIYGGDALLQHADLVIGINNPSKHSLTQYGPQKYIISDPNIVVLHYLKNRHGERNNMQFMYGDFKYLLLKDMEAPPTIKQ